MICKMVVVAKYENTSLTIIIINVTVIGDDRCIGDL